MTKINDGGPAFPQHIAAVGSEIVSSVDGGEDGMTLRDYFAAKAMQGMLAQEWAPSEFTGVNKAAEDAYDIADAMLTAREKASAA